MKVVKITSLFILLVLSFSACNTNDDDYYNTAYLTIPNLVQIQTQTSYNVGDYLYVNATINRLQSEQNQTTLLDLRKSTGNANMFKFSYMIEKQVNATDWVLVDASPSNALVVSGQFLTGSFYDASAVFNSTLDQYQFRTGIKLTTAGNYRLSFGYNSTSTNSVELKSDSQDGNIFVTIFSTINNLNSEGYYNFTVN